MSILYQPRSQRANWLPSQLGNPTMDRDTPALFPSPPACSECNYEMEMAQTGSNSKGNINRWFYKCTPCGRMVFDDWEGVRDGNPPCECDEISRVQKTGHGYSFYCARAQCPFRMSE